MASVQPEPTRPVCGAQRGRLVDIPFVQHDAFPDQAGLWFPMLADPGRDIAPEHTIGQGSEAKVNGQRLHVERKVLEFEDLRECTPDPSFPRHHVYSEGVAKVER